MGDARDKEHKTDEVKRGKNVSVVNYTCRHCFIVDGYDEHERKCRWCGTELFEIDAF